MELTIFAKKRTTADGKSFVYYLNRVIYIQFENKSSSNLV